MTLRSVACLFLLATAVGVHAQDTRPNIVLVYVDDMDAASMEELGGLLEVTRAPGLEFTQGFVPNSVCGPSRGALMTGTYNHTNGYLFNRLPFYRAWRDSGWADRSVARFLRQTGYFTAHVGKAVNGSVVRRRPDIPQGWDWYLASREFREGGHYFDFEMVGHMEGRQRIYPFTGEDNYRTDLETFMARRAMRRAVALEQPFFLYLSLYGPHAEPETDPAVALPAPRHAGAFDGAMVPRDPDFNEADVSDKHLEVRERRITGDTDGIDALHQSRLETMLSVEDAVRDVREELTALGVADNTYLFFVSDNGLLLGHHRVKHSKGFPYERTARVPFYVSGPGIAPGSASTRLVSIVDLAPTFLDLAERQVPLYMEGRSLVPLLHGEDVPWRQAMLLEGWNADTTPYYRALRTEDGLKYIEFPGTSETEIYDLTSDPYEIESYAADLDPDYRAALSSYLHQLATCTGGRSCQGVDGRAVPSATASRPATAQSVAAPEARLQVFPTPSEGRLSLALDLPESQAVRIEVFDAVGRRVADVPEVWVEAATGLRREMDLSTLPPGLYLVRVQGRTVSVQRQIQLVR